MFGVSVRLKASLDGTPCREAHAVLLRRQHQHKRANGGGQSRPGERRIQGVQSARSRQ